MVRSYSVSGFLQGPTPVDPNPGETADLSASDAAMIGANHHLVCLRQYLFRPRVVSEMSPERSPGT
jgi:hypothetical protein